MIGIDASRANTRTRTGTEWYTYFLIKELASILPRNFKVRLYSREPLLDDLHPLPKNFTSNVLRWPPKLLWTQLRLSLEMLIRGPELLFVPAHTIPFIHPHKLVTTLHDIGFESVESLYDNRSISSKSNPARNLISLGVSAFTKGRYAATELDYHRFSARLAVRRATKIITVSQFSRNEIINTYHIDPNKISVVHNSHDSRVFNTLRDRGKELEIQSKIGCGKNYIISIGRLESKKNTPRIISAFSSFRKKFPRSTLSLVLVGQPGFGYDRVLDSVRSAPVGSIFMPGWLETHTYVHLLRGAQAFVFPSLYEGFGIPLLEAMACGIPVITSKICSMPEVCEDAALYVDPKSEAALSKAIERIIMDSVLQERLRGKGILRSQRFSWHVTAQKTADIILEVLGKRDP